MLNKNKKILSILGIVVLAITFISLSYAFFEVQGGTAVSRDVRLTTHTVDSLSFSISNNILIEATQDNFTSSSTNLSGEATSTAILSPNSKTGAATKNYYMYLSIASNGINYCTTNTNNDPELMLQVFNSSDQLVTLTGLGTQKTIKGVTGYDITGVTGLIPILENHSITASNNTATTENYRVVVTLINLDIKQNEHAGSSLSASLIVREDELLGASSVTFSYPTLTSCTNLNCALNELYDAL